MYYIKTYPLLSQNVETQVHSGNRLFWLLPILLFCNVGWAAHDESASAPTSKPAAIEISIDTTDAPELSEYGRHFREECLPPSVLSC